MLDWRFRDLMFMMMVWCECGKGCNIQFATSGDHVDFACIISWEAFIARCVGIGTNRRSLLGPFHCAVVVVDQQTSR